jgi:hypothetical protein
MNAAAGDLRRVPGDTFTHGEARQAAVSDKRLYRLRDAGELIALGGGVYRWAGAPPADDDLVEIACDGGLTRDCECARAEASPPERELSTRPPIAPPSVFLRQHRRVRLRSASVISGESPR